MFHEPQSRSIAWRVADLLHPGYSGKIADSNPATGGDGLAVIILTTSLMGEDNAFDYLKKPVEHFLGVVERVMQ